MGEKLKNALYQPIDQYKKIYGDEDFDEIMNKKYTDKSESNIMMKSSTFSKSKY